MVPSSAVCALRTQFHWNQICLQKNASSTKITNSGRCATYLHTAYLIPQNRSAESAIRSHMSARRVLLNNLVTATIRRLVLWIIVTSTYLAMAGWPLYLRWCVSAARPLGWSADRDARITCFRSKFKFLTFLIRSVKQKSVLFFLLKNVIVS